MVAEIWAYGIVDQLVADEHRKDTGDGCRQHPYKREQCADRKCPRLRVLGTTLQTKEKEPRQRNTTKNHGRLGDIRQTLGYFQKQPRHLPEETGVQLVCCQLCHHLEIMTRKDGDQQSGGETTWTNTGATRYGRGQHKTVIWRRHAEAFAQPRDTTAA